MPKQFTQSLVLVHKTKRTSAAFDKLQLRVTTRYGVFIPSSHCQISTDGLVVSGYTIVPVVNEAEAAKVISKMVSLKGAAGVVVDLLLTAGRR